MSQGRVQGAVAALLVAIGMTFTSFYARADMAAAEALFREARELMAAGKIAEACPKFAESQRLDPSPGTLLNLARCHAQQGKTATAWAEYLSAKRAAQAVQRNDLAEEAQSQADDIVDQLSYLTISAQEKVQGLVVTRNGEALQATALGSKLPIDPGRYTIQASAPGRAPWSTEVTVEAGAASETVEIPPLEPAPAAPDAEAGAPPPVAPEPSKRKSPVPGLVVGGIGVAVTGAGLVFGGLAGSKYDDAESACLTHTNCSATAMDDRDTAGTFATISTIGVAVGVAGIATGVIMILTRGSTRESARHARVVPLLGPGFGGGVLEGAF